MLFSSLPGLVCCSTTATGFRTCITDALSSPHYRGDCSGLSGALFYRPWLDTFNRYYRLVVGILRFSDIVVRTIQPSTTIPWNCVLRWCARPVADDLRHFV